MPVAVTVRSARSDEVDAVVGVLAEAFAVSPLVRWVVPDPVIRRRCFAVVVERAVAAGHVDVAVSRRSGRPLGVAVWWGSDQLGAAAGSASAVLEVVPALWWDRFEAVGGVLGEVRPPECGGFARLVFLAVRPPMQRRGVGTLLLRHWHSEVDAAGVGASQYAVTSGGRDHLCKQYGYESTVEPVRVGSRGLPLWPLWREPVVGGR